VTEPAVPVETELRLAIDPDAADNLRSHPALKGLVTGPARRARVVTTYHDTADRRLRRDGVALRVRRDGRHWKLSIKGAALRGATPGTLARPELEWKADGPTIDLVRLMTTPWRASFAKALRKGKLAPVFSTDVQRTTLPLAFGDGTTATLAIDLGAIAMPDGRATTTEARIAELELELATGDASRLVELATRLAADLPVAIEPRGKAERGYALADGTSPSPSRAREIDHDDDTTAAQALSSVVTECVRQLAANTLGFRGRHLGDPEWVHQMRIGVRRLRSCVALADGMAPAKSLDDLRAQTRWVLDALGPARDLDVFADQTLPAVLADLERAGSDALAWVLQLERGAKRRRRSADDAALACVSSARFTRFVLAADGVAGALRIATGGEAHARARKFAARIIDKRARRLAKAGENLAHASIEARHATRIAAKKLRYATEFFATLFPRRRTKAYRDALAKLQDALGAFNDAAVASRVAGVLAGPTAPATVAIEAWSAARTEYCADAIDTAWARYAKARPFWTRD